MTITDEQQKRIDVVDEKLRKKRFEIQGLQEKTFQLSATLQSLRNSNGNIHGNAGAKYVEGSIEYLELCLEGSNLQPHIYSEKEKKDRCC